MSSAATVEPAAVTWENLIPHDQWLVYACILHRACSEKILFGLGGGLALGYYPGHLCRSKDLDIYISPEHRRRVISMMTDCGLEDYHDRVPYDREWIYRGHQDGIIVDAIWAMANKRASVDDRWTSCGPLVQLCGQSFRVIPPEELIWSKLYVLQRDRCDWPDILNLLYATGPTLDWDHMFQRLRADKPLLKGVLSVFEWLSPARAAAIPDEVWRSLGLEPPVAEGAGGCSRKDLLDSRLWLTAEHAARAA